MSITDKLLEPFPPQAIKTRQGGGNKRLSYVEGHTVIHRLIAATGNQFDLRVLSVDQKGDLMTALVELTIPGLGSRQHMGVQKIAPNAGEDLVKGAITDAMKKAATLFGVGLDLYGPDYGAEDAAPEPANPPSNHPANQSAPLRRTPSPPSGLRPAVVPPEGGGPPPNLAAVREAMETQDFNATPEGAIYRLQHAATREEAEAARKDCAKHGIESREYGPIYTDTMNRLRAGFASAAG